MSSFGTLSRRTFLKSTAAVTAGASAGLTASRFGAASAGQERPDPVVIGEGAFRYEVDHHWAKLPAGKAFGYTHGVVEDREGRVYIANQSKDAVMVFDPDGRFITSWGEAYADGAHGLNIVVEDGEEVLYLSNTKLAEVVKTTLGGKVIWKAETPDRPDLYGGDKKYSPTETAIDPDGYVYVADGYGESWIHMYTREGTYLRSFGGPGEEEHNLNVPHGIRIDRRSGTPFVQVSDRSNVRIVNFTLDGAFVGVMIPTSALRYPCSTFHAAGLLYVPDLFARVSIFGRDNRKIIDLGDYVEGRALTSWDDFGTTFPALEGYPNIPHEKRLAGKFVSPHALWVDGQGNIYVVEWIEDGRVTKLVKRPA